MAPKRRKQAPVKRASAGEAAFSGEQAADWQGLPLSREQFVAHVLAKGGELYRDLPWRYVDDPYAVLVSEVMLQQTQVSRVEGYWRRFLEAFPTLDALAAASASDVLLLWQGLGYNRRALALKKTADWCAEHNAGKLPETDEQLQALPGVGPATAAGVMAFARNMPACYIETNVRTVFLHELFADADRVSDRELKPYVLDAGALAFEQVGARVWYYALLDWGAHLKTVVANPSRRSAHYARQSAFEGSHRQKRSFVLRCVLASDAGVDPADVLYRLNESERAAGREPVDPDGFKAIVGELIDEGFFTEEEGLLLSR